MEEPSHATSPIFLLRFQGCPLSFAIERNWGNSLTFKTWQIWAQIRWPLSFWKLLFFFFFFSSYSTFMLFPLKYLLATALPFVGSLGPMEKHWWALSEWQAFCSKCASHLWSDCYHRDHKLTTGDKQAKNSKKVSEHKWKERIPASHLKATAFPSTWPSSQHELQILKI